MKYSKRFLVKPDAKVKLRKIDPGFADCSDKTAKAKVERYDARLRELQELLYAEHKHSLLICLQAMDTGGKDGTINHVLGTMNPQGCRVASFKEPSNLELSHDYLWRMHRDAPAKGEIAVFNRSHYEDVLIARVHDLVPEKVWSKRYGQINAMEKILRDNGTHILKFYLHISKDEQLRRFKERLDNPHKQWKISEKDYTEREYWDEYTEAFEAMLSQCSTESAPWFVIPANHKWFRNLAIAQIMVEYMEGLNMKFPKPTVDIGKIRKKYFKAKRADHG